MTAIETTLPDIQTRELALRERQLAIEERRVENERRAQRTPEEAALDVAIRQATTLADSPVLFYDEERVKKIALEEGGNSDDPKLAAKAWGIARTTYRNERIAFAVQLLAFAAAMNVPLALLAGQAHIVKGRVGFSTSFLIGLVNARAGLTRAIDWTITGEGTAALSVTCSAAGPGGEVREVTITLAQASRWGWGSTAPWKADPALMLRYRTAAQLIRLYFSAAVFGLPLLSVEELRDLPRDGSIIEGESAPVRQIPAPPRLDITPASPPPIDSARQPVETDYRPDQD